MDKRENRAMIESLRPHFVFNVLNVIRYMIKKDSDKAGRMVYDLALYMRCKIAAQTEENLSPFEAEFQAVSAYIRLEQVSMPNLFMEKQLPDEPGDIMPGTLLTAVEKTVKEQVRTTKEKRTLVITDRYQAEKRGIGIMVKETDVWILL